MIRSVLLLVLLGLSGSSFAQAYGDYRSSWEWSAALLYQNSEDASAGGGSTFEMDDAFGIGMGLGYYLTDRLIVGGDIEWLAPDYSATLVDANGGVTRFDHELTQINYRFRGTYLFSDGPLVPYAELGAGWTYVDSNVADGPPIVGCWYHPWFGYICDGYYETYSETNFSYGASLGFRYRTPYGMNFKLGYSHYEIDADDAEPEPSLSSLRFEVIWAF